MQDTLLFLQHHWMLSLGVVTILAALIIIELIKFQRGGTRLSPAQTTQMMNREEAVIVDIRTLDSFQSGHIIGAFSLPLADIKNKHTKLEKWKSNPIILVCAAGAESPRAATLLKQLGYQSIYQLAGGIRGWRQADLPLVKE